MELENDLICFSPPLPYLAEDGITVGTQPGLRKNYVFKISLPDDYIQRCTNKNSTSLILCIKSSRCEHLYLQIMFKEIMRIIKSYINVTYINKPQIIIIDE